MRILFVSHTHTTSGGAPKSLLSLIDGLDRSIYDIHVLLPRHGAFSRELDAREIAYTVSRYGLWTARQGSMAQFFVRGAVNAVGWPLLWMKKNSLRADVVFSNTISSPIGALLARSLGAPHILHAREFVHEDMGAEFIFGTARSLRILDQTTAKIICNSAAVRDKWARYLSPEKLTVIYNGFAGLDSTPPAPRTERPNADILKLCIVGSVSPRKGHLEAVRAVAKLVKASRFGVQPHPPTPSPRAERGSEDKDFILTNPLEIDVRVTIAGEGKADFVAAVKTEAENLGVAERIEWRGQVSDPTPIYRESDIALIPSTCEAFGRVAVEALAVSCPVVATDAGGLPEVIIDGETGLLYPPGDVDAFARQISRLAGDSALYAALSRRGIESVYARFGLRRYVSEVEAVIKSVS